MGKADIGEVIEHGIDRVHRIVYFGAKSDKEDAPFAEFSELTVDNLIKALNILTKEDPKKPIELHISSCGGDTASALRLVDYIQSCPCQIKYYGSGNIMSSATIVMAVCDERYIFPHTQLMVHHGQDSIPTQSVVDIDIYRKYEREFSREKIVDIYVKNTRMPKEFWEMILKRDTWLSPEQALMIGIIDAIIEPKKRGNLRKFRTKKLNKHPAAQDIKNMVRALRKSIQSDSVATLKVHGVKEEYDDDIIIEVEDQNSHVKLPEVPNALENHGKQENP